MSTVFTTTERHRPGSLRSSVRRLFTLASSNRSDSRPGMFDRAQNTSIQNATFTINQYGSLTMDHPPPVTATLAERQIASGSAAVPSRAPEHDPSPRPRRESPDVYVDCLLTENRGYPLWIPSPNMSLPVFNRTLGVSVGDVGVLTPEGGFDFLFNIFHDAAHPINAAVGVPNAFIPFTPAPAAADTQKFVEWKAGSFVADESMVRVDDGRDQSTIMLEATGVEGAALMIPEDIHTTKLKMTTRLRKYVAENIVGWYRFVKHTLGHDIENGDLRVVYGCRKSSGFGIATAFNRGRRENTRLLFFAGGLTADISRCPYRWSHTGSAEVKAGHSGEDNITAFLAEPIRNQCLFVNTIDTKISVEMWKTVELNIVTQVPLAGSSLGGPNSGKHEPTAKSGTTESTAGSTSLLYSQRAFHPSVILQDIFRNHRLPAYIVCDDDWSPFLSDNTFNAQDLVSRILQNRIIVEEQGMMFLCAENDAESSKIPRSRHVAHIRCRRVHSIENPSNDNWSYWKAERSINVAIAESVLAGRDFGVEKKKNENQSQNWGADSLPDSSEINTSSVSSSVTQKTHISRPSTVKVVQMWKDKVKERADERRNDIIGPSLSGTAVALGLVDEAAQSSNVPGLQNAASITLAIVRIVQTIQGSNRQYGLLAKDATDFIAAIWRSYQQSMHKEGWLSPDLRDVIIELVVTLTDITEFLKEKAKRVKLTTIPSHHAGSSQVLEYREHLKSIVKKFELTLQPKMVHQVPRDKLLYLAQHLSYQDIEPLPTGTMLLHALGKSPSGFIIEPPLQHDSLVSMRPRRHAYQNRRSVITSGPAGDSSSSEGGDSESRRGHSSTWFDTDTTVVLSTPGQLMQKGRQLFNQVDEEEEEEDDEQSEKQPPQYSSLLPEGPRRRSFQKAAVPRRRVSRLVTQPWREKGDSAQHLDMRRGDERHDNMQEEVESTSRSAPWNFKAPYGRYSLNKVINDSDAEEDEGHGICEQEDDNAHIMLASLDISP